MFNLECQHPVATAPGSVTSLRSKLINYPMMTREEILRKIDDLGPWFHCIDLGDGILTKTSSVTGEPADHPRGTWKRIERCLPADLSGKSILDVGCNAGF